MNDYAIASLRIVVVEALIGLLLVSYCFEAAASRRFKRGLGVAFGVVAVLAVLGYFNFGFFRHYSSEKTIHVHEQYHHYFGAEYLEELRYDGLYLATVKAATEDLERTDDWRLRDPQTRQITEASRLRRQADEIKARFSDERWRAFKYDRHYFFQDLGLNVKAALGDHANTGSPSWAMLASLFTRGLGAGRLASSVYGSLDLVLLLVLFAAVWRCYEGRTACIMIVVGLLPPVVYDYLGGSLLRLDWLFALGLAACCFKVGRYKTAGVFLGYAVSSKVFCGLVALALGLAFVTDTLRRRRLAREQIALVLAAVTSLGVFVALSSLLFGGLDIWGDYWERILATYHEHYYARNHSFRDLFLQAVHSGPSVLDWSPAQIAAELPHVRIGDHTFGFLAARLVVLAGLVFVIARHRLDFAFGVGVLFVFVVLVTNIYYWQMLLLIPLACADYRKDPRKLLFLLAVCVWLIAQYLFVPVGRPRSAGYFGSYWLALLCAFVFVVEVSFTGRVGRWLGDLQSRLPGRAVR